MVIKEKDVFMSKTKEDERINRGTIDDRESFWNVKLKRWTAVLTFLVLLFTVLGVSLQDVVKGYLNPFSKDQMQTLEKLADSGTMLTEQDKELLMSTIQTVNKSGLFTKEEKNDIKYVLNNLKKLNGSLEKVAVDYAAISSEVTFKDMADHIKNDLNYKQLDELLEKKFDKFIQPIKEDIYDLKNRK